MKKTLLPFIVIALSVASLSAQNAVLLNFTVEATVSVQNPDTSTAGSTVTIPAPVHYRITTKSLLTVLAEDEYAEGNYGQTTFPAGAKIIFLDDIDDFTSSYFLVTDSKGNLLVDVSDLLTFTQIVNTVVASGKYNNVSGLENNYKETYLGTLYFDDTGAGGSTQIYFGGLVEGTATDSTPGKTGIYKETVSAKLSDGVGAGTYVGSGAVVTGNASANGNAFFAE